MSTYTTTAFIDTTLNPGLPPMEQPPLSVTEFLGVTKEFLKNIDPHLKVIGEISGFSHKGRFFYFTLKDNESRLNCAIFSQKVIAQSQALLYKLESAPATTLQVVVSGQCSVFKNSSFELIVDSLTLAGPGVIMERLLKLKEKLEREGIFDVTRKRPLPTKILQVGVITSAEGKALQDILSKLNERNPGIAVRVYPARVQGAEAPQSLLSALRLANAEQVCQVLIIGRGGGALEDLLAFSDETLVRAVAASKIPIISAVGHTDDFALTDFAADMQAVTPTAAAELITPVTQIDKYNYIADHAGRLNRAVRVYLDHTGTIFSGLRDRLQKWPDTKLALLEQNLQFLKLRLEKSCSEQLSNAENGLHALKERVQQHDPGLKIERMEQVLERFKKYSPQAALDNCARPIELSKTQMNEAITAALHKSDQELMQNFRRLDSGLIDRRLGEVSQSFSLMHAALNTNIERRLREVSEPLGMQITRLKALNPLKVLERNYSITLGSDGKIVDFEKVVPGDEIVTLLKDGGEINSKVVSKRHRPKLAETTGLNP